MPRKTHFSSMRKPWKPLFVSERIVFVASDEEKVRFLQELIDLEFEMVIGIL